MLSKDTLYSLNQQREQCHTQSMPRVGKEGLGRKGRHKNEHTEGIKRELIFFENKSSKRVRRVCMDQYWRKHTLQSRGLKDKES